MFLFLFSGYIYEINMFPNITYHKTLIADFPLQTHNRNR